MRVRLPMSKSDPALRQIVGREFQRNFVAGQNANAISSKPAGKVRQHDPFMLELNAEQTAGKFFKNRSGYFYAVFLAHSTSRIRTAGLRRFAAILATRGSRKQNRAAAVGAAQPYE
jgi:hypothetical protein